MKLSILVTRMGDIIACWNHPGNMNHMLNWYATGWHGDPYAMVQKQKLATQDVRVDANINPSDSISILNSLTKP